MLAAKICPPGIEGALFAALMSIFNLGGIVSTEAGALLTSAFHVSETDFSNLAPLIATCALSSLLPLLALGWVRDAESAPSARDVDGGATAAPSELPAPRSASDPAEHDSAGMGNGDDDALAARAISSQQIEK